MIQFVDLENIEITPQERDMFDSMFADNDDPSKQHRVPIRAWHDGKLVPAFFWEPLDNITTTLFTELAPLFFKSQVVPYCQCHIQFHRLTLAHQQAMSAVSSFQMTDKVLIGLKDLIPRTVWRRLKALRGQTFFSEYEFADAVRDALQAVLTDDQIAEQGEVVLGQLQEVGVNEEIRQKRIVELEEDLAQFHGHAPIKPYPPTDAHCSICHSPYRYSVFEQLAVQPKVLERLKALLIGDIDIPLSDLKQVFLALEMWIFQNHDADLFAKKKTIVGTMLNAIHRGYQEWIQGISDDSESKSTDASVDSVKNSGELTPPPPPVPTLSDN